MAKCLSLVQPWASILVSGVKRCETRGWQSAHRGPLLIHAAKRWNDELRTLCATEPFAAVLRKIGIDLPGMGPNGMPFGAIIGQVDVIDCFQTDSAVGADETHPCFGHEEHETLFEARKRMFITPLERSLGDWSPGRYALLCANAKVFKEPVPFRGALQVFDVPDELLMPDSPPLAKPARKAQPWR